jgi:tetratricopeptide (TPR) repeat protein
MTPEETRKLVDHLDESRTGKLSADLENLIDRDPEANQEWYYLKLAVEALRNTGLHEQIGAARESLRTEQKVPAKPTFTEPYPAVRESFIAVPANQPAKTAAGKPSGGIVRSIGKYSLRAAACILVVAGSSLVYKYVTVSSSSLYDRYFATYALDISRGEGSEPPIVQAYNNKSWNTVLSQAGPTGTKDNQAEFLAGMADLQLNRCDDAITHFEQIIAANAQASTEYYQDEAEYYLAISWLACKKVNQAMPILEKIKADPQHKYYPKVAKMSFFDLRLAQYKENK